MKKTMTNKTLCILLGLLMLSGCSAGAGTAQPADNNAGSAQSAETPADVQAGTGDTQPEETKPEAGQTAEDTAETEPAEETELYSYSYQSHPISVVDPVSSAALLHGNFYTVALYENSARKVPALNEALNERNAKEEKRLTELLTSYQSDALEMIVMGFEGTMGIDTVYYPLRADSKAFSWALMNYTYMGGAHGYTEYFAYNIDPDTGKDISLYDVVRDSSALPQAIVDELEKQNPDLKEYFATCPGDRENLLNDIPERLVNNAERLVWALDYDGVWFYFEDYAMGSYAAGSQQIKVRFEDYPSLFSKTYDNYQEKELPVIDRQASKDGDAFETEIRATESMWDYNEADPEEDDDFPPVEITKAMQKKLNVFLSNFAEQRMSYYDYGKPDMYQVGYFAYLWSVINKNSDVKIDGSYYTVSYDVIKNLADKYLGLKVSKDDLEPFESKGMYQDFFKDGTYYFPAADGESYTTFAVAESAKDVGGDNLRVEFVVYNLDIDVYRDNDDKVPAKYYAMTVAEAGASADLTECGRGYAIVKKDGDGYKLQFYELYR